MFIHYFLLDSKKGFFKEILRLLRRLIVVFLNEEIYLSVVFSLQFFMIEYHTEIMHHYQISTGLFLFKHEVLRFNTMKTDGVMKIIKRDTFSRVPVDESCLEENGDQIEY